MKFDQDLVAWQNAGPPGQREHRQRAARQLRTAKRLRETSLTLQHLELDDLPECLAAMRHLTTLNVRHCRIGQLQALPPRLQELDAVGAGLHRLPSLPASLRDLTVFHNLLETLPELPEGLNTLYANYNRLRTLPCLPPGLRVLTVTDNRLTELPTLPPTLQWLGASNNLLVSLPEIPAMTANVEVHHNQLTDLPASITAMDVLEWVAIYDNPLPAHVLARVEDELLYRYDQSVFNRKYFQVFPNDRCANGNVDAVPPPGQATIPPPPLVTAVMAWHVSEAADAHRQDERRADWEIAFNRGLGLTHSHPSDGFTQFLDRLFETADYHDSRLRPELVARVCRLLDRLPECDALREQCYALATDALGECQDRIAAGLDHMELCVLNADAANGTLEPAQLHALGIGMLKLEELQTVCAEFCKNHPGIDQIELHLALRGRLATALELPITAVKMHYQPPSEITAEQWASAQERVNTVASDRERQIAFLAQWRPWQASLQRLATPALATAYNEKNQEEQCLQNELDTVLDRLSGLPAESDEFSESYFEAHAEVARLNRAFNQLEQQLIDPVRLQLTRELLSRQQPNSSQEEQSHANEAT